MAKTLNNKLTNRDRYIAIVLAFGNKSDLSKEELERYETIKDDQVFNENLYKEKSRQYMQILKSQF